MTRSSHLVGIPETHALMQEGRMAEAIACEVANLDRFPPGSAGTRVLRLRNRTIPRWDGEHVGRLVIAPFGMMGHGDFFQFARYLPAARKRCEHLTVICDPPLHAIARRCTRADDVIDMPRSALAWCRADAHDLLWLSLAAALGQTYGSPLSITPLPERVLQLKAGVRHIGLCWQASPVIGRARSIPFNALEPLRRLAGVQFHSLQLTDANAHARRSATLGRRPLCEFHDFGNWDDTVGLISQLDAVVTVDTSIGTVAGSLGVPTHILLHEGPCGYHPAAGDTSPWYPGVRLYRGSISQCVALAAAALEPC